MSRAAPVVTNKRLKKQILKSRGVLSPSQVKDQYEIDAAHAIGDFHKTPMMMLLEIQHKQPITILLWMGSLSQVASRLGLDPSTVSKWRKRIAMEVAEHEINKLRRQHGNSL